ncbi:hypothetical protein D3227_20235 [Mesorhizobium waimense]|uniref:Porin family protein n=1 Tax=Mesorhizobium waimense TaxID=1300307 RepID=A0A3A5KUN9_9HYPH|nr:outer membrane beta-barrel protein [Mesorhizobium waimense]RJT36418.1 hypothetical protein D3227_20235 [Mesorhizobium waimense]
MNYFDLSKIALAAAFLTSASYPVMAGDWSGVYVGGGVSFRKNKEDFPNGTDRLTMDDSTAPGIAHFEKVPDLEHEGNTIGGHVLAGYMFQKGRFVFGAEADYEFGPSFSDGRSPGIPTCGNPPIITPGNFGCVGLSTFFEDVKTLGHVRGVVGVELTPTLLAFGPAALPSAKARSLFAHRQADLSRIRRARRLPAPRPLPAATSAKPYMASRSAVACRSKSATA